MFLSCDLLNMIDVFKCQLYCKRLNCGERGRNEGQLFLCG